MTRPAPDCMSQDNTRADNMSGKVIYDLMHGGPGTGSLNTGSTTPAALNTDYAALRRVASVTSTHRTLFARLAQVLTTV